MKNKLIVSTCAAVIPVVWLLRPHQAPSTGGRPSIQGPVAPPVHDSPRGPGVIPGPGPQPGDPASALLARRPDAPARRYPELEPLMDDGLRPPQDYGAPGPFHKRHPKAWAHQEGLHAAQGLGRELLSLESWERDGKADERLDGRLERLILGKDQGSPLAGLNGPSVSRWTWRLYLTMDSTRLLHEQIDDILSDASIPRDKKQGWIEFAARKYMQRLCESCTPAPVDVTLRRSGALMKPYFGYFRENFPKAATCLYAGQWWRGALTESLLAAGDGPEQDEAVERAEAALEAALKERPGRMLLSREIMPRFSRMAPQAANVFDNLNVLHGLAFDLLAYPHWGTEQKKAELSRLFDAMAVRAGDEASARKFKAAPADRDPLAYDARLRSPDGGINRIALESLDEMLPLLRPALGLGQRKAALEQARKKLLPGVQAEETPGSLYAALKAVVPDLDETPGMTEPGRDSPPLLDAMMSDWRDKYGQGLDIESLALDKEPAARSAETR